MRGRPSGITPAWRRPGNTGLAFRHLRPAARVLHKHRLTRDDQGMRARQNLSGDRLVQDYLARVAAAARHLPKGDRMSFVGRTKAEIERQVRAVGTDDPGQVTEILAGLGTPEELVRAERLRIDSKWLKKRGRHDDSEAVSAAAPSSQRVYQPRSHRALHSRWKPATPPLRKPGPEAAAEPESPETGPAPSTSLVPVDPPPVTPAPWPGDLAAMMPPGPAPGEDGGAPAKETPLDGIWQLARGHLLESVAVVMIGLGGALLPFPFWLAGALVAMFSRLWDGKDKLLALTGPVLVDLLGSVLSAVLIGGRANAIAIYMHALRVETSLWIRLGCVLTALYLGWRVSQGRRVKIPPWQR